MNMKRKREVLSLRHHHSPFLFSLFLPPFSLLQSVLLGMGWGYLNHFFTDFHFPSLFPSPVPPPGGGSLNHFLIYLPFPPSSLHLPYPLAPLSRLWPPSISFPYLGGVSKKKKVQGLSGMGLPHKRESSFVKTLKHAATTCFVAIGRKLAFLDLTFFWGVIASIDF